MEIKSVRALLVLVVCSSVLVFFVSQSQAESDFPGCLKLISPLKKNIEEAQSQGGVWTIFSKTPSLNRHSSTAIILDSKISKLVSTLTYLCDTQNGVPLNELASYVSRKVAELGEKRFKNLHVELGKPEREIETWLTYTKIALVNRERILKPEKIKNSIQSAGNLISQYGNLFREFKNSTRTEPVLARTSVLNKKIDEFLTANSYVALAILEDSRIPFWDVDENYGGS